MSDLKGKFNRLRQFLQQDLWELELVNPSWWRRLLLHQAQLWALVVRDFNADQCMLRASALTFTTLLSLVPMLALIFAVLKGFGVQNVLEPLLLKQLAVGSGDAIHKIVDYINNTNVGRLGTYGLVFLIMTALTLLTNIEQSFNSIWGVTETRTILRRFTDYFSVVTIGPLLVVVAISMTSSLESQTLVQGLLGMAYVGEALLWLFKVLPFMVMWLVFAGLYLFMPNTRVSPRSALIGGVFGGTLWQLSQWGYINFQVGVARYNAIYGTMAALPILMFWIYISWMIVLLGLEMTYATQNLRSIRQDIRGRRVNFSSREQISLTVLLYIARRFYRGDAPLGQEQLATRLEVPPRLLRSIIEELQRLGLVVEVTSTTDEGAYQPARALERIDVFELFQGLADDGTDYDRLRSTRERRVIVDLLQRLTVARRESLDGMSLRDLVVEAERASQDQAVDAGDQVRSESSPSSQTA